MALAALAGATPCPHNPARPPTRPPPLPCRAPELVPPAAASLVGDLMVLSIIAGLNVGSGLGFLWLLDK